MRAPGPLALPLLAAVLLHALAMAAERLHHHRPEPPPSLRRADDTPELLIFSRQAPESPEADRIPLPPPEPIPSPPAPPLPPARAAVARAPRPAPPAPPARAVRAAPKPNQTPATLPPATPPGPLEALQRARQGRDQEKIAALEGEEGEAWLSLWRSAGPAVPLPAALAAGAEGGELRSLGLEQAQQQGIDPEAARVLRLDGQLLLAWIEAERLWLLKVPG